MEKQIAGAKKQKMHRQEVGPMREPGIKGWGVGYGHCAGQNGAGKEVLVEWPCKYKKLHWGNTSFTPTFFSLLKQSAFWIPVEAKIA